MQKPITLKVTLDQKHQKNLDFFSENEITMTNLFNSLLEELKNKPFRQQVLKRQKKRK